MIRPLALMIFCCGSAIAAASQPTERLAAVVLVRDAETKQPLQGARVVAGETTAGTDANGRVRLVMASTDSLRLGVGFVGYAPLDTTVALRAETTTYVSLALVPQTSDLGGVVVDAASLNRLVLERRGFYDRQSNQSGVFLTRADLDERNVTQFSDIFTNVSGVRIDRGRGLSRLISTRRQGCLMAVFIDGTEAQYLAENVDALPFDDVAAVEVYRGPSEVPMAYSKLRSTATCGAVLVWTVIQTQR